MAPLPKSTCPNATSHDPIPVRSCQEYRTSQSHARLDPESEARLDRLASQTGRTKAYYPRELIAVGLEDLEDYYLAAPTLERVRKGDEPVYSLDDVERDLDLAD